MTESNKRFGSSIFMRVFVIGVVFIFGLVGGYALQTYLVGGSGKASVEISAPTLDVNITPTPDNSDLQATIEALEAAVSSAEQQADDTMGTAVAMQTAVNEEARATVDALAAGMAATAEPTATEAPTEDASDADAESESTESASVSGDSERILYRISRDESEVRFSMGIPSAEVVEREDGVVGVTEDVAADIIVDLGNPANSQLGLVRVNARTMSTGRGFLDPIIRGSILLSAQDEYEFIEFQPTNLIGLPDSIAIGDTIEFQIEGDLTLIDVTNSVLFDVTVTLVDESRLEGFAIGSIFHADFEMEIPSPPSFVDAPPVADEIYLEIEYAAHVVNE